MFRKKKKLDRQRSRSFNLVVVDVDALPRILESFDRPETFVQQPPPQASIEAALQTLSLPHPLKPEQAKEEAKEAAGDRSSSSSGDPFLEQFFEEMDALQQTELPSIEEENEEQTTRSAFITPATTESMPEREATWNECEKLESKPVAFEDMLLDESEESELIKSKSVLPPAAVFSEIVGPGLHQPQARSSESNPRLEKPLSKKELKQRKKAEEKEIKRIRKLKQKQYKELLKAEQKKVRTQIKEKNSQANSLHTMWFHYVSDQAAKIARQQQAQLEYVDFASYEEWAAGLCKGSQPKNSPRFSKAVLQQNSVQKFEVYIKMYTYKLWSGLSSLLTQAQACKATGPYSKLVTREVLNSTKFRHGVYLLSLKKDQERPSTKGKFLQSIFNRQRTLRRPQNEPQLASERLQSQARRSADDSFLQTSKKPLLDKSDASGSCIPEKRFSEKLLEEIKFSLSSPRHPLMVLLTVFQQMVLAQISDFDSRVLRWTRKLQAQDIKLNNLLFAPGEARPKGQFLKFSQVNREQTILRTTKQQLRGTFAAGRSRKQLVNEEQELELIRLFAEQTVQNCKWFVFPVLFKALVYFYSPTVEIEQLQVIKEDLIIFLTDLFLSGSSPLGSQLGHKLQQLSRFSTFHQESALAEQWVTHRCSTLQDVGVDDLFCLNKHLGKEVPFDLVTHPPFMDAMRAFARFSKLTSPLQKMKALESMSHLITEEIDRYYTLKEFPFPITLPPEELSTMQARIPQVKPEKLVLDADQLLMIVSFVALKTKRVLPQLYSHINLVYEFSTDMQRLSQMGFCVSTLEVSLESMIQAPQTSIQSDSFVEALEQSGYGLGENKRGSEVVDHFELKQEEELFGMLGERE